VAAAFAGAPLLSACDGESSSRDPKTLNILTWETTTPPVWRSSRPTLASPVNQAAAGSPGEMLAKVRSAPMQYDIALVTAGVFADYNAADLLVPIDESRIENLAQKIQLGLDWRKATTVDGKLLGVVYTWGTQPLGFTAQALVACHAALAG
jgi:spermidine/putrescine-binding protein